MYKDGPCPLDSHQLGFALSVSGHNHYCTRDISRCEDSPYPMLQCQTMWNSNLGTIWNTKASWATHQWMGTYVVEEVNTRVTECLSCKGPLPTLPWLGPRHLFCDVFVPLGNYRLFVLRYFEPLNYGILTCNSYASVLAFKPTRWQMQRLPWQPIPHLFLLKHCTYCPYGMCVR